MRGRKRAVVPAPLAQLERRFAFWRKTRVVGERIPLSLWKEAARIARAHGLNLTARVLKLDYDSLNKHVEGESALVDGGTASFIELPSSPVSTASECIIELEDPTGSRMRVHLKGTNIPDVHALTRSFWNAD